VNYREAPTRPPPFDYKHKKQTGGSGQYGHVVGRLEPLPRGRRERLRVREQGHRRPHPEEYIPSCDKGFQAARMKGPLAGYEVVRVKMILEDGTSHSVDSSDIAYQIAAREAFKEAYEGQAAILEPIMKVEVEVPTEQQGTSSATSRRAAASSTAPTCAATSR
jgi:elongation factor G